MTPQLLQLIPLETGGTIWDAIDFPMLADYTSPLMVEAATEVVANCGKYNSKGFLMNYQFR